MSTENKKPVAVVDDLEDQIEEQEPIEVVLAPMDKSAQQQRAAPGDRANAGGSGAGASTKNRDLRSVKVPHHRFSPIKEKWMNIYTPLVEQCKLEVRMNLKTRSIDIRASKQTPDKSYLQKAEDFVRAVVLGFDVEDAMALLRLDDIYLDGFEVKDVRTLAGDNLSRCIGRMSGTHGRTKYAIENVTRTRIVIADTHLHIMGHVQNIRVAKDALVDLIRGSPGAKVVVKVRRIMNRINESI
eukprot:PhM_4_TR10930/c0_g1_i1/m.8623/K11884/PNO1, DIM2; RNA-binding protein PNO1